MTCNVNSYELVENNSLYNHHRLKLDQDTATDIATLGGLSAATIDTAGGIIAAAVGSTITGGIAALFGLIILAESAAIQIAADGCGVVIDAWFVNAQLPTDLDDVPYHYISSQ